MRPDRIIIGEFRGAEALDMLQAMNTGHEGSMTTVHANSPRDALSRLETMVLMAGYDLPLKAIREQITSALNIILHLDRLPDGRRVVTSVTELQGMEGETILLQDIFKFRQFSRGDNGRINGELVATGLRPKFLDKLSENGIEVPAKAFRAPARPPPQSAGAAANRGRNARIPSLSTLARAERAHDDDPCVLAVAGGPRSSSPASSPGSADAQRRWPRSLSCPSASATSGWRPSPRTEPAVEGTVQAAGADGHPVRRQGVAAPPPWSGPAPHAAGRVRPRPRPGAWPWPR